MGLFGALSALATMPIRVAVDVVKAPAKIMNGEDGLLENTAKGIEKIEESVDE